MTSVHDLVLLRWRTAQWLLALADGDTAQADALVRAMRVEGVRTADVVDEFALLRAQFGHRSRWWLVEEIGRLASRLGVRRDRG